MKTLRAPATPIRAAVRRSEMGPLRALIMSVVIAFALVASGVVNDGPIRAGDYSPGTDPYSMANLTAQTGVTQWWRAGYTGEGIDVALIDSGVAPVEGLDAPGKVAYGPDLSLESQAPALRNLDTYGHGTFMAGLIAGHDSSLTRPYADAPASAYRGIAPDARIISLKVATADGGADVTQVIAAIDWVVQHRNDGGRNIRVLNLSYGTNSLQSYKVDPLAFAVEQAWKAGIVVVAAAGNTGYQRGHSAPGLADPAYNPFVIGVGGYDTKGTSSTADDIVGAYSASSAGCGKACKNPDFVAVGSHLQGLRVVNSWIDAHHPEGVINGRYFRGSGTSEAAAVTSGAVALILDRYPSLTPDQVKRFVADNGKKVPGYDSQAQGAGEIAFATLLGKSPATFVQKFTSAEGTGSLEGSRGQDHLSRDGVRLDGGVDIFGHGFDPAAIATLEASGRSWSGDTWNGNSWATQDWAGRSWSGRSWSTEAWTSNAWSGRSWSTSDWSGDSWSGSSWTGGSWASGSWQ